MHLENEDIVLRDVRCSNERKRSSAYHAITEALFTSRRRRTLEKCGIDLRQSLRFRFENTEFAFFFSKGKALAQLVVRVDRAEVELRRCIEGDQQSGQAAQRPFRNYADLEAALLETVRLFDQDIQW